MTDTEAAWLAGIIDGEGSCMVRHEKTAACADYFVAALAVSNTSRVLVDRCKSLCGAGTIASTQPKSRNGKAKPAFIWTLRGPTLELVLHRIRPYVLLKVEQIDVLLALRAMVRHGAEPGVHGRRGDTPAESTRKRILRLAMHALNHRGTDPVPHDAASALSEIRASEKSSNSP